MTRTDAPTRTTATNRPEQTAAATSAIKTGQANSISRPRYMDTALETDTTTRNQPLPLGSGMNYTARKLLTVALCSTFVVIGIAAIVLAVSADMLFVAFLGSIFLIVGYIAMVSQVRLINKFQNNTLAWYRQQYPEYVNGQQIHCFHCGSQRITARHLMNKTYHREHFCSQCGTTLYYAPED